MYPCLSTTYWHIHTRRFCLVGDTTAGSPAAQCVIYYLCTSYAQRSTGILYLLSVCQSVCLWSRKTEQGVTSRIVAVSTDLHFQTLLSLLNATRSGNKEPWYQTNGTRSLGIKIGDLL